MDAWFSYVCKLSELIFERKLEAYEDACAALLLSAVGVRETDDAAAAGNSGTASNTAETPLFVDAASAEAVTSPSTNAEAAVQPKSESVDEDTSQWSTERGPTPSLCTTSPTSTKELTSESGADFTTPATTGAAAAGVSPVPPPRDSPSLASPVETVSALLDAMQLRKPLRTTPSRSHFLDDIQAEASVVYQDLEEVYALRPGDVSAARRSAAHPHSAPLPPPDESSSNVGPSCRPQARPFSSSCADGEGMATSPPTLEHQLLYGELTSVGVRQLQAISMASVSVSREYLSHLQPQSSGCGTTSPGHSFGTANGRGSDTYGHGTGLLVAGNVPRGAVVVGVDVGCGNGRLLFEWARLATAACRCRPENLRRRSHAEGDGTPLAASPSALNNGVAGGTYAAAARRVKLLAAALAPLGVHATNVVWRGWMGVGIEMVPSRIRVARRALVPHYLNLKTTLLVPSGVATQDGQREGPVSLLDATAPEAIAISASSSSCSCPASPASTTSTSIMRTPSSVGFSKSFTTRIPQPTARVLLYEGDALAPGVLSNATLCRFPHFPLLGDPLTLSRAGGWAPARTLDLVNGLGGEHASSFGSSRYLTAAMSAPGMGGAATCPHPTASVVAAGAALNNAFLNNAVAGVHGRRGGPASVMEMSMCSVTSNTSSTCSTRGGCSAKHNFYRLCRVEKGPSLTGREDPHLVVFCCGLGLEESQVWKLCQRLEDILLGRTPRTTLPTRRTSADGLASSRNMSEDEAAVPPCSETTQNEPADAAASPLAGTTTSMFSDDNGEVLEEMARGFGRQLSTPTTADPLQECISSGVACDTPTYRHWESVTCVLLLCPMDVLATAFPLFRYATRIYTTQEHPVAAEDTATLLATGNRADGTAAPYVMRDLPISDSPQDAHVAGAIQEGDIWTTTLETTWMNAAPAWVVRFRF
ncbi:hypothetical protein ABB37_09456 [Leptomonas pyrrhocoris]|uniref:Uncharacterized protein n=1 Tax=Leptomonas pyrrhocoris TaxID=157538 RepID=A0A0N0VCZ0_LEPPY|nr:hypothetical protein ABB37_09456 [Leptomonas pyrrhocoris]KPA74202.1 hypothetical protein ABB37_09456 [Leptomonas pyrrhocoris]|eukprot:XP_015652641.1 hypothetical protein ABB37_09456 [Leptomonas pyrrhocoris]